MDVKTNDEYKPKCPACKAMNFRPILDRNMQGNDKPIALVICEACGTVVGALPYDAVWNKE